MGKDLSKEFPGQSCARFKLWVQPLQESDPEMRISAKEGGAHISYEGTLPRGVATLLMIASLRPEAVTEEMDKKMLAMARDIALG